jgi:hypothetical protein
MPAFVFLRAEIAPCLGAVASGKARLTAPEVQKRTRRMGLGRKDRGEFVKREMNIIRR